MPVELPASLQVDGLVLRSVREADYPFLRSVYRDVRRQELAPTGWPQSVQDAFCDSQFSLQDRHYRAHYQHARFYVIERGDVPIGRIYISDAPELLILMEVSLLSSERGQGHGTAMLRWLTGLADASQRPVRLHVEPDNPAKRLYARHGFVAHETDGPYQRMLRPVSV